MSKPRRSKNRWRQADLNPGKPVGPGALLRGAAHKQATGASWCGLMTAMRHCGLESGWGIVRMQRYRNPKHAALLPTYLNLRVLFRSPPPSPFSHALLPPPLATRILDSRVPAPEQLHHGLTVSHVAGWRTRRDVPSPSLQAQRPKADECTRSWATRPRRGRGLPPLRPTPPPLLASLCSPRP